MALQSLIAWNRAAPSTGPRNETVRLIEAMRIHSPYTSRADPAWGYIDDYLWYVLLWMDVYEWLGDAKDLEEAVSTLELSAHHGSSHSASPPRTPLASTADSCSPTCTRSDVLGDGHEVWRYHLDVPGRRSEEKCAFSPRAFSLSLARLERRPRLLTQRCRRRQSPRWRPSKRQRRCPWP